VDRQTNGKGAELFSVPRLISFAHPVWVLVKAVLVELTTLRLRQP